MNKCLTCKHFTMDQVQLSKIRLLNEHETKIKSTCKKNNFVNYEHDLEFLLGHDVNDRIRDCKNYEPIK